MGLRFESNYQRFTGAAPFLPDDSNVLTRWIRVHEWQVDPGYQANVLCVMLAIEPQFATWATYDMGWMRLRAILDNDARVWQTKFEAKFISAAMTGRASTPAMLILPMGDGILFSAGQGLMTQGLPSVTTIFRWWSCYVMDSSEAT